MERQNPVALTGMLPDGRRNKDRKICAVHDMSSICLEQK